MSLATYEHPIRAYSPPGVDYDLITRQLGPDDRPQIEAVRSKHFQRKYIDSGLLSAEAAAKYAEILDKPAPPHHRRPTDTLYTGVFKTDDTVEELVAVQWWGISSYPPHQETDQLIARHAKSPGTAELRPAYIQNRWVAETGQNYGTVVRHASSLVMQANSFVIVGHKLLEADWTGHVDKIEALDPVLLRRYEASVAFPVTPADVYGTQRTEVYVGIGQLLSQLESERPWLAESIVIDNPVRA